MSTPVWADPRQGGAGTWASSPSHGVRLTLLGTVVVCFASVAALLLLIAGGRHLMCATHDNALSYCPGYEQVQR